MRESGQCKQITHPEGAQILTVNESTENTLSHHPNERMARMEVERKVFFAPFASFAPSTEIIPDKSTAEPWQRGRLSSEFPEKCSDFQRLIQRLFVCFVN